MAEPETKTPAKTGTEEETTAPAPMPEREEGRHPLAALRDEMDRLFDDFFGGISRSFRRRRLETDPWRRFQGIFEGTFPAADVVEGERDYRITAELAYEKLSPGTRSRSSRRSCTTSMSTSCEPGFSASREVPLQASMT